MASKAWSAHAQEERSFIMRKANILSKLAEQEVYSWVVAGNGSETPIEWHGYTYLYMYNTRTRTHAWYVREQDLFIENAPFDN